MHSTIVIILLTFVACTHGKQVVQRAASAQDTMGKLYDRVLGALPMYCSDLENLVLAKDSGHRAWPKARHTAIGPTPAAIGPKLASGLRSVAPSAKLPIMLRAPGVQTNSALGADLGCMLSRPTSRSSRGRGLLWSRRKHAQIEVARAISDSDRSSDLETTLLDLDRILNESSMEEKLDRRSVASGVSSQSNKEAQIKRGDQRVTFRKLGEQAKRQSYIPSLLGLTLVGKVGKKGMEPDFETLKNGNSKGQSVLEMRKKMESIQQRLNKLGNNNDVSDSKIHQTTTVPVMLMSFPIAPGELITLNLFEPRWITLFAKLAGDNQSSRLLRSASGFQDINLDKNGTDICRALQLYEMSETDENMMKEAVDEGSVYGALSLLVPGYGRLDESPFVGTKRFGVALQPPFAFGETMATVGTIAEILATDVKIDEDGMLNLIVVARGVERFRATRMLQEKPYHVVDVVPLVDVAEDGQEAADREVVSKIKETLANETQDMSPFMITVMEQVMSEQFVTPPDEFEMISEPAMENVRAGIELEAKKLSALALGVMLLRSKPKASQALLTSTSATERRAQVKAWLDMDEMEAPVNFAFSLLQLIFVFQVATAVYEYFFGDSGGVSDFGDWLD